MLTPQDVRAAQFEKNIRGYRTEEVDRFLDKVEEQLKQDEDQAEELRRQIAELTAENQRLHKEMESYEADGDMLKSALINAQRMGENVIREANQKSEEILHRANLRGDDIIRDANELLQKASDRADEIINEANEKKLAQEREYDRVRLEVTRFKSDVLNLYRSHVESLSRLPEFQKEESAEDAPAEDEAAAAETTAAAVTEEIAEAQPAAADVDAEDETPADEKTSEEFWAQDESQLKLDPPPADPNAVFQGVSFSEWIQQCADVCGAQAKIIPVHDANWNARDYFPFRDYDNVLDVTKIHQIVPEDTSFETGLTRAYRWFCEHRGEIVFKPKLAANEKQILSEMGIQE